MGIPLSRVGIGCPTTGVGDVAEYGTYDLVRNAVNSVSRNGEHSMHFEKEVCQRGQEEKWLLHDAPFSRNSSSWASMSFRSSLSCTLCLRRARI